MKEWLEEGQVHKKMKENERKAEKETNQCAAT